MTSPTYLDHTWHGSPAAMSEALAALGWTPAGTEATLTAPPHIAGIVGPIVSEYADAPTWTALIRSTIPLQFPSGVGPVPSDMAPDPRETLGNIAMLSPRKISASAFLARFTPTETAALWAADPRLMAGAMRVMTQGSANLDSPDAQSLLALAVTLGVLSQERASAILA